MKSGVTFGGQEDQADNNSQEHKHIIGFFNRIFLLMGLNNLK